MFMFIYNISMSSGGTNPNIRYESTYDHLKYDNITISELYDFVKIRGQKGIINQGISDLLVEGGIISKQGLKIGTAKIGGQLLTSNQTYSDVFSGTLSFNKGANAIDDELLVVKSDGTTIDLLDNNSNIANLWFETTNGITTTYNVIINDLETTNGNIITLDSKSILTDEISVSSNLTANYANIITFDTLSFTSNTAQIFNAYISNYVLVPQIDTELAGIRGELRILNDEVLPPTSSWKMYVENQYQNNANLVFTPNNGDLVIKMVTNGANAILNFTGQHRCIPLEQKLNDKIGYIVSATGEYKSINSKYKNKIKNISINESLPIFTLSKTANDKKVFGVISNKSDETTNNSRSYAIGAIE